MGNPNPFLVDVEVTFTSPDSHQFVVPGFYFGNGENGMDGDQWMVRFSADKVGFWEYSTVSSNPLLDGLSGFFEVIDSSYCQVYKASSLPDFSCTGRLQYSGGHYLQFANGDYWIKGGENDPEDFLAPGNTVGFGSKEEAVNYLAENGVNSLYIILQNIDGDGNNVWPWVGITPSEARNFHERINLSKMAQWDSIFSYLQEKGIVLHLVFEDDDGWTGFNRSLYYREMIARFGHYNGIIWNVSEEYNENYTPEEIKSYAQMLRDLDPYNHPISVHHSGPLDNWVPFLGDARFDLTSFQTTSEPQNQSAATWFEMVEYSGRTIPVSFDETGTISPDDQDLNRHILWSVYMGGGNFELHSFPLSSYLDFGPHLADMNRGRSFIEELPFWQMRPMNELLLSGQGYVFAKDNEVYSIYLPYGGQIELDLSATATNLHGQWFNPRDGSSIVIGEIQGGVVHSFSAPTDNDWVLLIEVQSVIPAKKIH